MNFKKILFFFLGLTTLSYAAEITPPEESLTKLIQGNERYFSNKLICPERLQETRTSLIEIQTPMAVVLGCSDSRVPPEIIFDQGIGDLFVVRVAGNVAGPIEMDSIEYAIRALNAPLIVVLGHQNCGAVQAFLKGTIEMIPFVAAEIQNSLNLPSGLDESLEKAIKANVRAVVEKINTHPEFVPLIQENKLKVVGGYYKFSTGKVELLSSPGKKAF